MAHFVVYACRADVPKKPIDCYATKAAAQAAAKAEGKDALIFQANPEPSRVRRCPGCGERLTTEEADE